MAKKVVISLLVFAFLFILFPSVHAHASSVSATDTVSVSAKVGEEITITPGGGNGGGGGRGILLPKTAVTFSGAAYPFASVSLLRAGNLEKIVQADNQGDFNITIIESNNGTILYSLFAKDVSGTTSLSLSYHINVQVGYITQVSGILFTPTISTDKSQIREGGYLTVYGYSLPSREMEISISSNPKKIFSLTSSKNGTYIIVLPLTTLSKGTYSLYIHYKNDIRTSKLVWFTVAAENIFNPTEPSTITSYPTSLIQGSTSPNDPRFPSPPSTETDQKNSFVPSALQIIKFISLLVSLFIFFIIWRRRRDDDTEK